VRIGKLDRGPYTLGVEIVREAPEGRRRLRLLADQAPHPAVVFLSNETVARDDLAALLDALQGRARR
jgi:dihydroneopterin aldolase